MSKAKNDARRHRGSDSDHVHHGFHRPYWKHAHYDWRLWVAVSLMLIAVFTYVMSDDLAWRPWSQSHQVLSSPVVK
jgi:hypothetical protein